MTDTVIAGPATAWAAEIEAATRSGRLAALIGDGDLESGITIHAVLAGEDGYRLVDLELPPGQRDYPSLSPTVPAAFWYERRLHDLYGVIPVGHPRLDPLVLPHREGAAVPSPGSTRTTARIEPDESALAQRVIGRGVFTIPHGPVRSGVFESVEYLVETPGEDILHLNVRPHAKHRGIETRFTGMDLIAGVLLAERVEGIASVAHAISYCQAVEGITGTVVPRAALLVRAAHAELERIANHLDVTMKIADAAGLAVAVARFGRHKERVLRLVSALCGNRFGRGVVVPGGVRRSWADGGLPDGWSAELDAVHADVSRDAGTLMVTASFLDRLRKTGPLTREDAVSHGVLGPVGRGSGYDDDLRWHHPYGAYAFLTPLRGPERTAGDALARLWVRLDEVEESFALVRQALETYVADPAALLVDVVPTPGQAIGAAEAPQGEVLYLVRIGNDGRILRCAPRSASFVNLSVFPLTFVGDILTDFPFNEASFGVSVAGVTM